MTTPIAAAAERPRIWSRTRSLASAATAWALLDGLVLFGTFPYWPRTAARWALLLAAGPAMLLSLAGLLELAVLPRLRRAAAAHAPRWAAAALPVLAVAAAVALAAWWTLRVEGP